MLEFSSRFSLANVSARGKGHGQLANHHVKAETMHEVQGCVDASSALLIGPHHDALNPSIRIHHVFSFFYILLPVSAPWFPSISILLQQPSKLGLLLHLLSETEGLPGFYTHNDPRRFFALLDSPDIVEHFPQLRPGKFLCPSERCQDALSVFSEKSRLFWFRPPFLSYQEGSESVNRVI